MNHNYAHARTHSQCKSAPLSTHPKTQQWKKQKWSRIHLLRKDGHWVDAASETAVCYDWMGGSVQASRNSNSLASLPPLCCSKLTLLDSPTAPPPPPWAYSQSSMCVFCSPKAQTTGPLLKRSPHYAPGKTQRFVPWAYLVTMWRGASCYEWCGVPAALLLESLFAFVPLVF